MGTIGDTSYLTIKAMSSPIRMIWPVSRSGRERRHDAEKGPHGCRAPACTGKHSALEAEAQGASERVCRWGMVAAQCGPHGRAAGSAVGAVSSTRADWPRALQRERMGKATR